MLITTNTICGENSESSRVQEIYKPRNINVFLVNVDHNGMEVHRTRSDSEGF
jgi:hypothetical protein